MFKEKRCNIYQNLIWDLQSDRRWSNECTALDVTVCVRSVVEPSGPRTVWALCIKQLLCVGLRNLLVLRIVKPDRGVWRAQLTTTPDVVLLRHFLPQTLCPPGLFINLFRSGHFWAICLVQACLRGLVAGRIRPIPPILKYLYRPEPLGHCAASTFLNACCAVREWGACVFDTF